MARMRHEWIVELDCENWAMGCVGRMCPWYHLRPGTVDLVSDANLVALTLSDGKSLSEIVMSPIFNLRTRISQGFKILLYILHNRRTSRAPGCPVRICGFWQWAASEATVISVILFENKRRCFIVSEAEDNGKCLLLLLWLPSQTKKN